MKAWNRESRELKLKYREKRARLEHDCDQQQTELSYQIDIARNELHYYNQDMRKEGADIERCKERLDRCVKDIRALSNRKVHLDLDRKMAIVELNRKYNAELDALEAKYAVDIEEEGGES